ncbi:MAG: hypothetical protein A3I75_05650 [Deltaproteobacteria bacterium RIFCSPLOWO2_02_FULL_50_16]|nr:MAG: hypothetical protein A2053_03170 [Deltaproteobacteria bacterium GWA2_50_8]OGQ29740.1 MAG: hypothetical protein A3B79_05100 [Deltaproteobacteria bacterium RIFCSPHIGHO2_02_FULL_50_15]OGQ56775.1 MAG: hypothetical protein A3I75_05650 [Deltaproteobacteria bacterium RIFCSPLOWO2_02_FULL_50_16]OGQ67300.1 MAG: hypothetical protein A3F89_04485 [Deltaproteobacteria bacterium RIFCSPLOWO2_12_FULL_50_11]
MGNKKLFKTIQVIFPKKNGNTQASFSILEGLFKSESIFFVLTLRFLFFIFWYFPPLTIFRFKTLGMLSEREKQRYFEWWKNHRYYLFRQCFDCVKTISLLVQVGRDWEPTT